MVAFRLAPRRVVVPCLVEAARAQQVFGLQRFRGFPPGDRLARQKQRFGKMLVHEVEVVNGNHDRSLLAVPALDQRHQVDDRLGVDGVERLVEQDDLRILHQHAGKQRPLQLPA